MKKLILLFTLSLIGCASTMPPGLPFPEVDSELMSTCPNLKSLAENTTKLSDILETVNANYSQYYICKAKIDGWIEWYTKQKNISETVK